MTAELIGRDAELSAILAFLDRRAEGPVAMVLEGEPGIGKSTLWVAGVAAARDRSFRVLLSRPAEAERTLAHVVLGDMFADTDPEILSTLPAPRRRAFEAALLQAQPDMPVDPRALGIAILTLLPILADGRPLVLAIDDDQWMDGSSAATLRFTLRRLVDVPVLLLLSRRSDPASTTLEGAIDPGEAVRLQIGPLSMGAIQLLLRRRLGISFARPRLLRLHEQSGGNPFFALELARVMSTEPAGHATEQLAVPPSLDRLVRTRLDALDASTRQALLVVAAHGRLQVDLLRTVGVAPVALDEGRAANVIEISDGVVRFTHPLLASALYQGTPIEDRRSAHRRLATALDDAVDRGRHLALSTDAPDAVLADAIESAVIVARDRGMPIAAADLAEHALRLTPVDLIDHRHRRALLTAHAHLEAGEGDRAKAIFRDLLARTPPGPRRAEALLLTADLGDADLAIDHLQQALPEAKGVPRLEAAIHAALADFGRSMRGGAWAERHARAALRLAEHLGDNALRVNALSFLAAIRFDRGDPGALEMAERAYGSATSMAEPQPLKVAGWSMGHILAGSGTIEPAREWLERMLDEWRDRDEPHRDVLLWYLAQVEFWAGQWVIASDYAEQSREIAVHYATDAPGDHLLPALIALHRGDFAIARNQAQHALSLAGEHIQPQQFAILAICDLWSGQAAAALAAFLRAEQAADARGWDEPNLRWWRADYVDGLLQLGRIDEAAGIAAAWEAAAGSVGRERVFAQAIRCRGLIAAARGDLSAAERLLEQAVDRHEAVGDQFGRGRASLALGVVRLRARQKRAARTALKTALEGFEALGATSWADVARTELARIGGSRRIEGLSPSELRVAELVAEGRTNREIASALYLGERTVTSHLTHIYAKLEIRSRTELARRMHPKTETAAGTTSNIPTF